MPFLTEATPPRVDSAAAPRVKPAAPRQIVQRACCASCATAGPCESERETEVQDALGHSLRRAVLAREPREPEPWWKPALPQAPDPQGLGGGFKWDVPSPGNPFKPKFFGNLWPGTEGGEPFELPLDPREWKPKPVPPVKCPAERYNWFEGRCCAEGEWYVRDVGCEPVPPLKPSDFGPAPEEEPGDFPMPGEDYAYG